MGGVWVGGTGYSGITYATRYQFSYNDFSLLNSSYKASWTFNISSSLLVNNKIGSSVSSTFSSSPFDNSDLYSWPYISTVSPTPAPDVESSSPITIGSNYKVYFIDNLLNTKIQLFPNINNEFETPKLINNSTIVIEEKEIV